MYVCAYVYVIWHVLDTVHVIWHDGQQTAARVDTARSMVMVVKPGRRYPFGGRKWCVFVSGFVCDTGHRLV